MIALLTSEALQVINVGSRAHHHLERWNYFAARCAVTGISEESVKEGKYSTFITVNFPQTKLRAIIIFLFYAMSRVEKIRFKYC